jgi:hypothetical protein
LDWYQTLFEVIDMRSFSNLWYWIAIAVTWSTVSHWVIGVPFDMLQRARRQGGQADADFEAMVRINVNRLNYIRTLSGVWLVVFASMVITALAILGFWYGVEFAQAVFLLAFPLSLVAGLSFRTAEKIASGGETGELLKRRLIRHRFATQVVGMLALVVTAFWGMWRNLQVGAFGGF